MKDHTQLLGLDSGPGCEDVHARKLLERADEIYVHGK
jgi:hypothetical protein